MFRKATNENSFNSSIPEPFKTEVWTALELLKGMGGREVREHYSILALSDWLLCFNEKGEVKLPFPVKGLYFRPGMPPANFEGDTMAGAGLIIGHRVS